MSARDEAVRRLWEAATGGDERGAVRTVREALDAGMGPEEVLLDVIAAVQRRVGEEWAANRLSVADEHAATAIDERAVAAVCLHPAARTQVTRGRITVACVDGEWHALPARLLTEVLRLRGWQVDHLGAQVPGPHLVKQVHRGGPDAVALSGSLVTRLPAAHAAITACQAAGVPVLVGGAAFGADDRTARRLGADAWAADARGAADLLAAGLPAPSPLRVARDALPHLADQEYTLVARARPQLVRDAIGDLAGVFPPFAEYDERRREHTAEDVAHVVEHLSCALYMDDREMFLGFVRWTAGILENRGVPAYALAVVLRLLAGYLRDFPRATALLDGARAHLDRSLSTAAQENTR
ncbi:cobalamin B12-binding domain-containing protein [Streptomyces sp. SP18CS02]|uniref:cobalamin B12-binding domain-containing protein n=1 Tax=Streptomyces sp. SP18CS02 TaxID=3002531 RepID=UPI002E795616|nr:cobalamin-dependent protein [Streptomyces sp. SP18CS02]MEE1757036.1 cobalamin-dependent protein [Streptomyces sp. SP18CS02]